MIQITFRGKFTFDEESSLKFIEDVENLIVKHKGIYEGAITRFQFEDCEIIEDVANND